jgi:hypothetical protein
MGNVSIWEMGLHFPIELPLLRRLVKSLFVFPMPESAGLSDPEAAFTVARLDRI